MRHRTLSVMLALVGCGSALTVSGTDLKRPTPGTQAQITQGQCTDASIADATCAAGNTPDVAAGTAESVGTTGLSINGTIHPHGRPTSWYVEYGPTATYGLQTKAESLPPRLTAFYHETWDLNAGGWQGGMSGADSTFQPTGGVSGGFLRFSEPSGNDPNHVDGIGTLHLCKYVYPGLLTGANGTTMLSAGDPDFRNARVQLKVRGNSWQANGSELVWWTQSQSNIELLFNPEWRRANWAYTGYSLTPLLSSGKWESVEYRLSNDSTQWSYGGNNLAQNRPNYIYWPINESQRHLNNDFFHLLTFVDPANLPQGSIDFDELVVAYHNYSLLIPSNGGQLVSSPEGAAAATLTDGWRHGDGKTWKTVANPTAPQDFVWKFEKPVTIEAIRIHQHTTAPTKSVEIAVSSDNLSWTPLSKLELPESSKHGPNYVYGLVRPQPTTASFVKVSITSGYKSDAWGLGEIEVFGAGATLLPEDEPTPVTVDLADLTPGSTCHYRLVAVSDGKTYPGEARTVSVPATSVPQVSTLPASRITTTAARLEARLNPMGKRTQFWFEFGTDSKYGQRTPEAYGGLQITPRLAALPITGLTPGMTYHYRVVAKNETGTSTGPDMTFKVIAE